MTLKKYKLKRKSIQTESIDYIEGTSKYNQFLRMNKTHINRLNDKEKEEYMFLGGFYAGCHHKQGG
jgi:hypothetical protein